MLLAKLREYADERMDRQPPPLYSRTPVAYIVALDSDGRPRSPHPISRIDSSTPRGRRGLDITAPEIQRAAGIKPLLLADNGEYTFGRARDPKKPQRAAQAHASYLKLLERCAAATEEPAVLAVRSFYERGGVEQLDLGEEWDYGLKVTFSVLLGNGEVLPIDLPAVQRFWRSVHTPGADAMGQCLVCGERKPLLDRLQAKIKGIRGGQSSGTSIVSANSEAFESYGLKASKTAPTCYECGEGFTRAANEHLAGENSCFAVGGATFIFWTRKRVAFNFGSFMRDPNPAQVRALLDSVRSARHAGIEKGTAFYAISFSANGGRAVVRDWMDTTVGRVQESVARWFELQRITHPRAEDPEGDNPRPLGLYSLAVSTVRRTRDLPVTTPRVLFRVALAGGPVPLEVAFQAVRRNRAERNVTAERAALTKLVLLSHLAQHPKEDYMVALEPEHPEPAYHCGRLLAVIESVQYAALGRVNATVVDRFYGAASSTPAVVFGALLRGAQPHLAKLEGRKRGGLQNRLMEVCGQIRAFPKTLSLEQQALFSLGYYHQRAHDRAAALSRTRPLKDAPDREDTIPDTQEEES